MRSIAAREQSRERDVNMQSAESRVARLKVALEVRKHVLEDLLFGGRAVRALLRVFPLLFKLGDRRLDVARKSLDSRLCASGCARRKTEKSSAKKQGVQKCQRVPQLARSSSS